MAITMTCVGRRYPQPTNPKIDLASVSLNATGDASGGDVTYNSVMPFSLLPSEVAILDRCEAYQDDASTKQFSTYFTTSHWSGLFSGLALATQIINIQDGTWFLRFDGGWCDNPDRSTIRNRPIILGNPLITSPTITAIFVGNTNTKTYQVQYHFLIHHS